MNGSSVIDGRLWGKSFFKLLEQQLILMVVLLEPGGVVMHGSVGTQSNGFALGANHYTYAGLLYS